MIASVNEALELMPPPILLIAVSHNDLSRRCLSAARQLRSQFPFNMDGLLLFNLLVRVSSLSFPHQTALQEITDRTECRLQARC